MFTGLVEEMGTIRAVERGQASIHLRVGAALVMSDIKLGDSVAVNGVCLTVTEFHGTEFTVDVVPETLRRSTLHQLTSGSFVNLERALPLGGRLGGHLVAGHVDGVGIVQRHHMEGVAHVLTIQVPPALSRYIVEKGSVCVDGVSLTVMEVVDDAFRVSVIPHTGQNTTLLSAKSGRKVNIECDMLVKYVEKLLLPSMNSTQDSSTPSAGVNMDFLQQHGFL